MGKWDKFTKREKRLLTCNCGYEALKSHEMNSHLELYQNDTIKHASVSMSELSFRYKYSEETEGLLYLLASLLIVFVGGYAIGKLGL